MPIGRWRRKDVGREHGVKAGRVFARRDGRRRWPRVVFATLGGGVSIRVVPELTWHPGAEYDTKSWQGAVDVGVPVCLTRSPRMYGVHNERHDSGVPPLQPPTGLIGVPLDALQSGLIGSRPGVGL